MYYLDVSCNLNARLARDILSSDFEKSVRLKVNLDVFFLN